MLNSGITSTLLLQCLNKRLQLLHAHVRVRLTSQLCLLLVGRFLPFGDSFCTLANPESRNRLCLRFSSSYFRFVIIACVFCEGGAAGLGDLLVGGIIDVLEGEESEVGEGSVDADIETEVGRQGIVVVELAVAVTVEHDGSAGLLVPRDHRVVAHHHTKVLLQKGCDRGAETHLLDLVDLTEVVLVGADGTVVIALDEELVAGEFLQQVAGIFALEECEVAKDVDGVALVDSAAPEVEQPLVVGRDVHRIRIRALGRVFEDV